MSHQFLSRNIEDGNAWTGGFGGYRLSMGGGRASSSDKNTSQQDDSYDT
jgi:hypothetical protein